MVKLTIDGHELEVPEGTTILKAAAQAGIHIPTLCYLEDINDIGACRMCVVEVEGCDHLPAACNTAVAEGMVVSTTTPRVIAARRMNIRLLLSRHNVTCTTCIRSGNCELQRLANELNVRDTPYRVSFGGARWQTETPLIREPDKCIRCMRCVAICDKVQGVHIWEHRNRASHTTVGVVDGKLIDETMCALCGQCVTHCPTGALTARDDTDLVLGALADPEKIVLVQIAPAVRAAWGEPFGMPRERATVKRLVAAIRRMGFDYIFDTDFSADLTIMEEGSEFVDRLTNRAGDPKAFPMFTSCCPGWVRYIKGHYPQFVDNLSTAKSPQQMFGAVAKSWYAELLGVDPNKIFSVSVMPCLAKKHECALENMNDAGAGQDVDVVLTTREVDRMIQAFGIDPTVLDEEEFDEPLGTATGAGVIFGATGGVMEAALRSAYFLVTGENPDPDAFRAVRGMDGWKEAAFDINGTELHVAVASGLGNTKKLMDAIASGEVSYDFVEIMACPGGCAGGGGQPINEGQELAGVRGEVLYGLDKVADLRFSHENPSVQRCYEEYLGAPLSEKAHHLLHSDHHAWSMPHA